MNTCISSNEASISRKHIRRKHIWIIADTLIRADLRPAELSGEFFTSLFYDTRFICQTFISLNNNFPKYSILPGT